MMNTNEREAAFAVLLKSDAMLAALEAEDSRRMAAHQAAVDALLIHEAGGGEIEKAAALVDDARAKLAPIETKYLEAVHRLSTAESHWRELAWRRELTASHLRNEAARTLPAVVAATETGLRFAVHEIRNCLRVEVMPQRAWNGVVTNRYTDNQNAIGEALEQVEVMRAFLGRLTIEPMPQGEIVQTLSKEAGSLIELAKTAGAEVAHHLPSELRPGIFVETPKRAGTYAFPR